MYFWSLLHGQATSFWPGARGAPTECMQGTKLPFPSTSSTFFPILVMIFMFTTT